MFLLFLWSDGMDEENIQVFKNSDLESTDQNNCSF